MQFITTNGQFYPILILDKVIFKTHFNHWTHFYCYVSYPYFISETANNSELLEKLEELMATWSRQIEQVLVESEQIRREADNIGPLAELNYWKSRMAKFNT